MMSFVIPGQPIAQPRTKACVVGGHARVYTPSKSGIHEWKALARQIASEHVSGSSLLDSPVSIAVTFLFDRPKSMIWKKRPMPREWHTKKPDVDNLVKALLDALTSIVWRNDTCVCKLEATKWYAGQGESAKTIVQLQAMSE